MPMKMINLTGLDIKAQQARLLNELVDVVAPDVVEIQVNQDTGKVWVNVCGVCLLRVSGAGGTVIERTNK